jgi:hypothetical protein
MKKAISFLALITLLSLASTVKAEESTEVTLSVNTKSQEEVSSNQSSKKYNFTLFSFFSSSKAKVAADTSGTEKKVIREKPIKESN